MRGGPGLSLRFVLAVVTALVIGTSCGLVLALALAVGLFL